MDYLFFEINSLLFEMWFIRAIFYFILASSLFLKQIVTANDSDELLDSGSCSDEVCVDNKEDNIMISREKERCEKIKDLLFHSIDDAKEARKQWLRFLPVFMKTQMAQYEGVQGELEFPIGHDRFNLLGPIGPRCKNPLEKYGKGDEEKRACGLSLLQSLNPVEEKNNQDSGEADGDEETDDEDDDDADEDEEDSKKELNGDCVVFSIGSNNQWMFEEAIINQTSCRVETFDCTMDKQIKPPKHLRHRVRLHPLCLSDRQYTVEDREYVTWHQILEKVGLKTAPTFLKMDIEGYEFPVLKSIIDAGIQLPLQISMELHIVRHEFGVPQYTKRVSSMELHSFIQYVYEFGGYYLIDRHDNPYCRVCSEIVLAKIDCDNYPLTNYDVLLKHSNKKLKKALKQSLKSIYYS